MTTMQQCSNHAAEVQRLLRDSEFFDIFEVFFLTGTG
jgi:hypothetical protein